MALRDILVHMDNGDACATRLQAAADLAARHEAHLVGLYVIQTPVLPAYVEVQVPQEIQQLHLAEARKAAEAAHKRFEEVTSRAGVAAEWRVDEGELIRRVTLHARYADLVVVSRAPETGEVEMPDRLILSVGRPVLVVPRTGTFTGFGKHVLVAWDTSRLACRAINDAMPLLAAAEKTTVMSVNPVRNADLHGEIPGADMGLHLARHGVNAIADQVQGDDVSAPELLLSRAVQLGADLIVMGAYGHSRWRELVMGGATRYMLSHASVPVLMSH